MRLSKGHIEELATIFQDPVYLEADWVSAVTGEVSNLTHLSEISRRVVFDLLWWTPWAPMDHGIKGSLVEGRIDRGVLHSLHVADVHQAPLYAFSCSMTISHLLHNGRGKVDAELTYVAPGCKVNWDSAAPGSKMHDESVILRGVAGRGEQVPLEKGLEVVKGSIPLMCLRRLWL